MTVQSVQLLDLFLCPFDTFEISDRPDPQLARRIFVRYQKCVRVELNARNSVHMVDAFLYALCQGVCLVLTDDDDENLSCVHDGLYANGERHTRDFKGVVVEESRVVEHSVVCEGLDPRARGEGGTGLVERNVTIGSDTGHEKIDSAHSLDFGFVVIALGYEIRRVSVKNVDVLRLNIDVREKVVPHERVVRLRVRLGQSNVFVHVEGDYVLE